ncbi:MAG: ABC transporter substrate-binding protein [Clostridia bacterium]|nr:ABC transporter substrate-binding protein [Clostridia bacterium]
MGFIKRCILVVLTCMMCCCHALASNVENSLVVGIQSSKTLTIRPLLPIERDMISVYDLVYESLIYIDDDFMPQGQLAQSWDVSSNGKIWTFYLRPAVTFSDGQPLTARDVVASAQYILDRANDENTIDSGFYANLKFFISGISAKDDSTVEVRTQKRPCYGLLYAMTFPIVPADQVDMDNPAGTGPYRFNTFVAGDYAWLQANTGWWKAQPQVQEIMFSFHDTQKAVMESYEYARVDAVFSRSIAAAQYKSGISSLSISYRTNQLECLLMNNSASELTQEVREAIRHVVDVSKIASNVYSGMVTPTNLPFYPGTWTYNDSLSSYFTLDQVEARRLLAAAGWGDADEDGVLDRLNSEGKMARLHLRFYVYEEPENDVRVEAANRIAEMLAAGGIDTTIDTMTMANLQEKLAAGSYDLALVAFSMDTVPDPGFMLMRGNTGNYTRYRNEKITEMFEDLRKQTTQAGYQQVLWQIQAQFAHDCPFLCLYWRKGNVLTHYMYTTARDVRELELLRGIETFHP